MKQQEIKYIRECLAIRERRLKRLHCTRNEKEPTAIAEARELIRSWECEYYDNLRRKREAIEEKIRQVEEQLILGESSDVAAALAQLDSWVP